MVTSLTELIEKGVIDRDELSKFSNKHPYITYINAKVLKIEESVEDRNPLLLPDGTMLLVKIV